MYNDNAATASEAYEHHRTREIEARAARDYAKRKLEDYLEGGCESEYADPSTIAKYKAILAQAEEDCEYHGDNAIMAQEKANSSKDQLDRVITCAVRMVVNGANSIAEQVGIVLSERELGNIRRIVVQSK